MRKALTGSTLTRDFQSRQPSFLHSTVHVDFFLQYWAIFRWHMECIWHVLGLYSLHVYFPHSFAMFPRLRWYCRCCCLSVAMQSEWVRSLGCGLTASTPSLWALGEQLQEERQIEMGRNSWFFPSRCMNQSVFDLLKALSCWSVKTSIFTDIPWLVCSRVYRNWGGAGCIGRNCSVCELTGGLMHKVHATLERFWHILTRANGAIVVLEVKRAAYVIQPGTPHGELSTLLASGWSSHCVWGPFGFAISEMGSLTA